tara:strand:+ start:490 stop:3843 length:3354 start_codon:yes stop_codon:yes gene_type:complete
MKKALIVFALIFLIMDIHGQNISKEKNNFKAEVIEKSPKEGIIPEGLNYQAVARNERGEILANQRIGIQIQILKGENGNDLEFEEIHHIKTNDNGLFSIVVGQGDVNHGKFTAIEWEKGNKWLQLGVDLEEKGNFSMMGKSQMLSVPYAMYAKTAGSLKLGATNRSDDGDWSIMPNSNDVFKHIGNVGIGATIPKNLLHIKSNETFPINIENNGAKFILFTKGPVSNSSNKLGWIGYSNNNDNFIVRNARGNMMTFESNGIFNIGVSSSTSTGEGSINMIFKGDGNFRIYNKGYSSNLQTGDHPKVGIGVGRSDKPAERLEVRGGIKLGEAIAQYPQTKGHIQYKNDRFLGWDGYNWHDLTRDGDYSPLNELQDLTAPQLTGGNSLKIGITDGSTHSLDLSPLLDNTDNQNISGSNLNGSTLIVGIEGGNSDTVDLSSLKGGTEHITEGGNTGIAITGRDSSSYGNIGNNAVDLSYNVGSTPRGATGEYSVAMGYSTEASGAASTAIGYNAIASDTFSISIGSSTEASGYLATAIGSATKASGDLATALGNQTTASGNTSMATGFYTNTTGMFSTAMGQLTEASGGSSTAMGNNTVASGGSSTAMGNSTEASGTQSTAMGTLTDASGDNSTSMGFNTEASGDYSTAMGMQTTASGIKSTAMGQNTEASGNHSTAMGYLTIASENYSTAMGNQTTASGDKSIAMGYGTEATGDNSTAMGNQTDAFGNESTAMGNQTTASGDKSTAMGYLTTSSANSSTAMGKQTNASGDYSTSMGYRTTASGDNSTAMGNQTNATGQHSTAMGAMTTASGHNSTAMGFNATASGDQSLAIGLNMHGNATTIASGDQSLAMGFYATASGDRSIAIGLDATASGISSTAIGNSATASGLNSTAIGHNIKARSKYEFAIGCNNTDYTASSYHFISTDRLFVIGNGTDTFNRADAMVVLKNGNTGIGTSTPTEKLEVSGNVLASNVSVSSDARFKENISSISGALDKVEALNGVYFDWRSNEFKDRNFDQNRQIGFIAQDLEKIIPEVVKTDSQGWKSVSYDKMTALLVEAIKEMKLENDSQKASIEKLLEMVELLTAQNKTQFNELNNIKAQYEVLIKANDLSSGNEKVEK